jgi:hypothetical protein
MELDIIKYFIFLFSSVLLMWGLSLWLKKNKNKRKKLEEEKNLEN